MKHVSRFSPGEYVRISENNKVVKVIRVDQELVFVLLNGKEETFFDEELEKIESESPERSRNEPTLPEWLRDIPEDEKDRIWLCYVPEENQAGEILRFHIHILNLMSEPYKVQFYFYLNNQLHHSLEKIFQPGSIQPVFSILPDDLNKQPEAEFMMENMAVEESQIEGRIRFRPNSFFKRKRKFVSLRKDAFAFALLDVKNNPDEKNETNMSRSIDTVEIRERILGNLSAPKIEMKAKAKSEIDLHAEVVFPNHASMTVDEILNGQIEIFTNELNRAIASRSYTLTVIHGVGSGKLKTEIHKIIRQHKGISYTDGYIPGFGWGATIIKIN